jgi:DNA-binding transcriptional LysR family regulator
VAAREKRQVAADFGRWSGNGHQPRLAIRAAVDGLGIAYTLEALAEMFLRSGQLVRVLADWSPTLEGLFLFYPGSAGAGRTARLHRHDPHGSRRRTSRAFTREPVHGELRGGAPSTSQS